MSSEAKEIVVITGGSGCLAQHLIRELQLQQNSAIKEIRIIDKRLFDKYLDYPENIPVIECIGDCAQEDEILPFFKDATVVYHMSARAYNFDMYPNKAAFWRDNVQATEVVIAAARKCDVPFLVYTSDAMAGVGNEDSQALSELAMGDGPADGSSILDDYGRTKCRGQKLVRAANGTVLSHGGRLSTVVVSPTALYGEGDNWFLPHLARVCRKYGKRLQRFGDGVSVLGWTYAGNAAHAHLLAAEFLRRSPAELGGEVFLCSEQTLPVNYFRFVEPFVQAAGFRMSSFSIPFLTGWLLIMALEMFFYFFYAVFGVKFPHELPNARMERIAGGYYFHFNTTKARLVLDYKPKYEPQQAKLATLQWWQKNCHKF